MADVDMSSVNKVTVSVSPLSSSKLLFMIRTKPANQVPNQGLILLPGGLPGGKEKIYE